jgi:hypothetical protein
VVPSHPARPDLHLPRKKVLGDALAHPLIALATGRVRNPSPETPNALALSVFLEGRAMFPAAAYDPETLGVLTRVFDEA